jgi:hypothetical protein
MTSWYASLKDFQAIIGTLVGFVGVIITLIYNSHKDRAFHRWREKQDQKVVAVALRAELEMYAAMAKRNYELKPFQSGGGILVPKKLSKPNIYQALSSKVMLLPVVALAKVIHTYVVIEEFPANLWYAIALTKEGEINTTEIKEDFYQVRSQATAGRAAGLYGELIKVVEEAIEELKKI